MNKFMVVISLVALRGQISKNPVWPIHGLYIGGELYTILTPYDCMILTNEIAQ